MATPGSAARLGASLAFLSTAAAAHAQTRVVYVDQSAPAGGDGTSWQGAFNNLRTALVAINTGPTINGSLEIRVAQGTYRAEQVGWQALGFELSPVTTTSAAVVALKGSFLGRISPTPDLRDFSIASSTLSGDVLGNDTPTSGWDENAHTVLFLDTRRAIRLLVDGFTVRDGHSNNSYAAGGIFINLGNYGGQVEIANCAVESNTAGDSAGIGIYTWFHYAASAPSTLIRDSRITGNRASRGGGIGVSSNAQPALIRRCAIEDNWATEVGGGIWADGRPVDIDQCVIRGNHALDEGGAVFANAASVILQNSLLAGNVAGGGSGGAVDANDVHAVNCTLVDNLAPNGNGAGIRAKLAEITNCLFARNAAYAGQDIFILGTLSVSHSSLHLELQGQSLPGGGTLFGGSDTAWTLEPRFVNADGPDGLPATWQDNDYRLAAGSPAIDAGLLMPGLSLFDAAAQPRLVVGVPGHAPALDLGCFEFQGTPRCPADLDNGSNSGTPDGAVTIDDLLYFLARFELGC